MRKLVFLVLILILLTSLIYSGCSSTSTTTGATPTTTAASQPVSGGKLTIIASSGPQILSYVPLMGPGDRANIFEAAEALLDTNSNRGDMSGGVEPVLCSSFEVDQKALTITYNIRHGVFFSDGSELTAEVAQWNMQQCIDAGNMPYIDFFKSFSSPDKYTLVVNMKQYNNQMAATWGWWTAMYSKKAWDEASGGDLAKGKEWARAHLVGTGPFILQDFQPDVSLTWVKNPNYWQKGKPYLDEIDVKIIPDAVTARAAFEAGQGDILASSAKDAVELIAKGYFMQVAWPVLPWGLWPNTANPASKMSNKSVREALEYAINKEAITKAIGHGLYKTLKSLPWEGEMGYDATMGRGYNPDKAKELLASAGYSAANPCKVTLLNTNAFGPDPIDACTAVKQQLDAVGFEVTIDQADAGRFFGTAYGKDNVPSAEQDLLWYFAGGCDTNYLQTYVRWFSTQPFTYVSYLGRTAEQASMDNQAMGVTTLAEQTTWAGKLMHYIIDNALVIPVYGFPGYVIQQKWVHSTQYTTGFTRWQTEIVWMDKH
jgi:peptide/nickel transport system substrate-binding protein